MSRGGGRGGRGGGGRGYAGRELMKNHYEDLDLDMNDLNQSENQQNRYNNNGMNEVDGRHPLPLYPTIELPTISPSLDHIKLIQKMRMFHNRVKSSPYYITRTSMEHNDIARYSDIRKNSLKSGNILNIVKESMTKRNKDFSESYCPAELFNSKSKSLHSQNSRISDLDYSGSLLKLEQLEQHNNSNGADVKEKAECGSDDEDNDLAEAEDLEGEDDDYNIDHYADSDNEMDDNFGLGDDNEATF